MALLSNQSHIVPTVMIDLTFENNVRKIFPVECQDIIRVTYNKNGLATTFQGRVTSINAGTTAYTYKANGICNYDTTYSTNKNGPYITIDGSDTYDGKTATVYLGTIIDCDMIYKWSDNFVVSTPPSDKNNSINSIQLIRVREGKFEVSSDYGESWYSPETNDEPDQETVDAVKSFCNDTFELKNSSANAVRTANSYTDGLIATLRTELKEYVDSKIV